MAAIGGRRLQAIVYFVVFLTLRLTRAFNIDTKAPIIKIGRPDSYFGFSIAHHFIQSHANGAVNHVLLVGAPRDNVTDPEAPQTVRELVRPGAVYYCPLTSSTDDCQPVKIDREDSYEGSDRNDQWLGVSVVSQGTDDGRAMACAHRYKLSSRAYRWGLGQCFAMTNALDEENVWSPCEGRPRTQGHSEYGFCQAGISSVLSKDNELLIGAPGPYNWRGSLFKNKFSDNFDSESEWYHSPVEDPTPANPLPDPATGYYAYLGMSVKMATFDGVKWYIGGAPRSRNVGEVLMFHQDNSSSSYLVLDPEHILMGEQFGSGFGYDIVVGDFNLDKKDDLVVGAPFYHASGIGGAIYIYYNSDKGITPLTKPQVIFSRRMKDQECVQLDCQNAWFGYALANIGDMDRDGFQDLAVGAPYEGSGAVYIFRGSPTGIMPTFSQRIVASEFNNVHLRAFGASVAGGADVDNNGYSDLAIGAFSSHAVVLLRARPVVNINVMIINEPDLIDSRVKTCPIDGSSNVCFLVKMCFRFTAEPRERFKSKMSLHYWLDADKLSGSKLSRAVFVRKDKRQSRTESSVIDGVVRMNEQTNPALQCVNHTAYVTKSNRDFLNPIPIHLSYNLTGVGDPTLTPGQPLGDINDYPIVSAADSQKNFSVDFVKNCGDDHLCHSNIRIQASVNLHERDGDMYILRVGESEVMILTVQLANTGEDAHETSLTITLPSSVDYLGTDSQDKDVDKYTCSPAENVIYCAIGNPLPGGQGAALNIRLNPLGATASAEPLHITVQANTTSTEVNKEDDQVDIVLKVIAETDLLLRGSSDPSQVVFGGQVVGESAVEVEDNIGPQVVHNYEVKNIGNAAVDKAVLYIRWPYETTRGQHLLYLLEGPVMLESSETKGYCKYSMNWINPLGIKSSYKQPLSSEVKVSRQRRDVDAPVTGQVLKRSVGTKSVVRLNCEDGSAKCHQFECILDRMLPKAGIAFRLRARLWNSTFVENYADVDEVKIISFAQVMIDPSINIQQANSNNDIIRLETIAIPDISVQGPPGIPLWIIIVSVIAGVILLALVIILLWKCGFFRRTRSGDIAKHKAKMQRGDVDEYHD